MEGGALCGIELAPRGEVEAAMAEWICETSNGFIYWTKGSAQL